MLLPGQNKHLHPTVSICCQYTPTTFNPRVGFNVVVNGAQHRQSDQSVATQLNTEQAAMCCVI